MSIHLIIGPMFAGKSRELIKIAAQRRLVEDRNVEIFGPVGNTRDGAMLRTRDPLFPDFPIVPLTSLKDFWVQHLFTGNGEVFIFDEAHFYSLSDILEFCELRKSRSLYNVEFIFAGLDSGAQGGAFPQIEVLRREADRVTLIRGKCAVCGGPSTRSQYVGEEPFTGSNIDTGKNYEPRCETHFKAAEVM